MYNSCRILGIFYFASGRLSPYLVAHDQLQDALDQLTNTIRLAHARARLVEPRSEYYYKYSSLLYAKVNNTLYISVSVPISVVPFPFKIHQIQITPFQINTDTLTFSKLVTNVDYLAVAINDEYLLKCQKINCSAHWWPY